MRKRLNSRLVIGSYLLAASLAASACSGTSSSLTTPAGSPTGTPIRIAEIIPLQYTSGKTQNMAGILAAEEINKAGGIKIGGVNHPIDLKTYDSNEFSSIPDATATVEKAINVDKADFVIGGFRSEAVFAMSDVAMNYKKIFITTGAAAQALNDRVTSNYDKYKYFFMLGYPNANYQAEAQVAMGEMAAEQVKKQLGIAKPKIAILCEQALWADPTVALAQQRFADDGYEVVGTWRPSSMATDITTELSAINAKAPQIIFIAFSGPVGITYSNQVNALKMPVITAGYNIEAQSMGYWNKTSGGANYEGPYYDSIQSTAITPLTIPFWNNYVQRWNEYPNIVSTDYQPIYILKAAIERAGTIDNDAVVKELEKTDMMTPFGHVVLNSDHSIKSGPGYYTFVGYQWKDGKQVAVWPPADGSWNGVIYNGTATYQLPPVVSGYWGKK